MVLQINFGFVMLVLIFFVVIGARYLLMRKAQRRMWSRLSEELRERENFLEIFSVTSFDDFDAFDFIIGGFSHVSPFPAMVEGEWRYRIYLSRSEVGDIITIVHEIVECTVGRVIERLLNLEKPLYLQRKEDDKFWVQGKKRKYLVEHVMATLGEAEDLTQRKLRERLEKEDAEDWLNLRT